MTREHLKSDILRLSSPARAKASLWFFKTGKGQYGEGDVFIGLSVPQSRALAKKYATLPLTDALDLLRSPVHEERLIALLILITVFQKGDSDTQRRIYDLYLSNTRYINNWDLVDTSASQIVGAYLLDKDTKILQDMARSSSIWERRIAIISTAAFIKAGMYDLTLKIALLLISDEHDLIHKAVGWMLREVGNRSRATEKQFLKIHYKVMPRTMLRYAIEKFPEDLRKRYLTGNA